MILRNYRFTISAVCILFSAVTTLLLQGCSYEEAIDLAQVEVALQYPPEASDIVAGARVELRGGNNGIFVDSTDVQGVAHFNVPPGIYEASTSQRVVIRPWRYIYNGVKGFNVVTTDSINTIRIKVTMSKKRVVN